MRRALVLAACIVLVVGGFLIARGAKDDGASSGTTTQTTATQTGAQQGTGTTSTATTPTATPSPAVQSFRISVQNGKAVGGQRTLKVKKGDRVRIIVTSDVAAEAHLHGYEIEKELAKDTPGVFAFKATIDGVFRLELHTEPEQVLAELQVSP
jgi:FtsP/CotA-like multicopper oxidase with cupredoxin domain